MAMNRRDAARILAIAPVATAFRWAPESVREAAALLREALEQASPFTPKFFSRARIGGPSAMLVDLIIPADAQSGSATQAGVPEFIDFMCVDDKNLEVPVRGGLAWLDTASREAFGKTFVEGADARIRMASSTRIAWPKKAETGGRCRGRRSSRASGTSPRPDSIPAAWACTICNTSATPSSPEWKGCPPEALAPTGSPLFM